MEDYEVRPTPRTAREAFGRSLDVPHQGDKWVGWAAVFAAGFLLGLATASLGQTAQDYGSPAPERQMYSPPV